MFSNKTQRHLIEVVREFKCLYDSRDKQYGNFEHKEMVWEEIGKKFDQTGSKCKIRWNQLRDTYRRALKKKLLTQSTPGSSNNKVNKWKFEDEMSFLMPHLKEMSAIAIKLADSTDNLDIADDEAETVETLYLSTTANQSEDESIESISSPSTPKSDQIQKSRKPAQRNKLKRTSSTKDDSATKLIDYIIRDEKCKVDKDPLDEIDHLFLGLAGTVKKMSAYNQALAKSRLFSVISELELEDLQQRDNS